MTSNDQWPLYRADLQRTKDAFQRHIKVQPGHGWKTPPVSFGQRFLLRGSNRRGAHIPLGTNRETPETNQHIWHLEKLEDSSDAMQKLNHNVGVSENRVPLNPMVNDHYPY